MLESLWLNTGACVMTETPRVQSTLFLQLSVFFWGCGIPTVAHPLFVGERQTLKRSDHLLKCKKVSSEVRVSPGEFHLSDKGSHKVVFIWGLIYHNPGPPMLRDFLHQCRTAGYSPRC